MGWFKRIQGGITASTNDKKEIPEGLWYKCPKCRHIVPTEEHELGLSVCQKCGYHERAKCRRLFFFFLFDDGKFKELDSKMESKDPLKFVDIENIKIDSFNQREKLVLIMMLSPASSEKLKANPLLLLV